MKSKEIKMLINIKEMEELKRLQEETGKPLDKIVNEILEIHLNKEKRNRFLMEELDKLFKLYRERYNIKD